MTDLDRVGCLVELTGLRERLNACTVNYPERDSAADYLYHAERYLELGNLYEARRYLRGAQGRLARLEYIQG